MPQGMKTVSEILKENKEDLEAGTEIMMQAQELMLDPDTHKIGARMMSGARDVWIAKGEQLIQEGKRRNSKRLVRAGRAHIKSSKDMSNSAFKKAMQAGIE